MHVPRDAVLLCAARFTIAWCAVAWAPALGSDPSPEFFRAINLNGPSLEIDAHLWEGSDSPNYRTSDRAFENQSVPLRPETDPARAQMIRSSRWNNSARIELINVPAGQYSVLVYVWEDNNPETIRLVLQERDVAVDLRSGEAGEWRRLGPFVVEVGDDQRILLTTRGGAANLSGIEIWRGVGPIPEPGAPGDPPLPEISEAAAAHFTLHVAPLLARHCLECHAGTSPNGGLDLAHWQRAMTGGDSGAVIVAGKPDESLLWQLVAADAMPQDRPPLSAAEKGVLRTWIEDGAPWGAATIDPFMVSTDRRAGYDWWSLQPVRTPVVPSFQGDEWSRNEIDRFILARLRDAGLSPAEEADRRTLIRRVTFDLTGLPPAPAEVQAFERSDDPRAYEQLVERLLQSPHYGERWARHWLDVIRFGESQGYERNKIREHAWRYRDWVIEALNANMPYDEFIRRQLAGDVLYPDDLSALIATGYHVCGTWDQVAHLEGSSEMQRAARQDELEDLVSAYSQAFLGLTVNCARCHDHKFDPIPQRDYYRIAALLSGVNQTEAELAEIRLSPDASLASQASFDGTAHVVISRQPGATFVLARGDYRQARELAFPAGLTAVARNGLPDDFGLGSEAGDADRRRALAVWTADPRNPLTARVFVNRVWHYHCGCGIVDTPSDFGFNGGRPSHPELLDWLAARFVDSGWDVKELHRLIVTSATYCQASQVADAAAEAIDADNRLRWRFNRRRLEGEEVRDAMLAVSGALNSQLGGPSYRDMQVSGGVMGTNAEFTDPTHEFSETTCRRTIYRLWARSGNLPMLESLDCPDPTVMSPERTRTITPLQALSLLNGPFAEECAKRFAARLNDDTGGDQHDRIVRAYRLAFGRRPTDREMNLAREFIDEQGLEQFCLVLMNTNAFLFVD